MKMRRDRKVERVLARLERGEAIPVDENGWPLGCNPQIYYEQLMRFLARRGLKPCKDVGFSPLGCIVGANEDE